MSFQYTSRYRPTQEPNTSRYQVGEPCDIERRIRHFYGFWYERVADPDGPRAEMIDIEKTELLWADLGSELPT